MGVEKYIYRPRNFTFSEEADRRLFELSNETGKTMTAVIEDSLLGRRQFSYSLERFIDNEMERTGMTRRAIIEDALAKASVVALERGDYRLNEPSSTSPSPEAEAARISGQFEKHAHAEPSPSSSTGGTTARKHPTSGGISYRSKGRKAPPKTAPK